MEREKILHLGIPTIWKMEQENAFRCKCVIFDNSRRFFSAGIIVVQDNYDAASGRLFESD
ncbi:hypothetical protein AXK61_01655 [Tsukamurella pseudospumae]|uniref:Uncharacterized protein n=1 Tax=Tsukamurella pseudospumae TaxID=239498 RepID=A0A137ZTN1_9ACTN|nr:hypothetical protein AXK61_01655 [Tsukamurella pseudospumae]